MMNWHSSWGWHTWLGVGLTMLVVWSLIAVAVAAAARSSYRQTRRPFDSDAQSVLDRRYASGEITEHDYTRRRELLAHSSGPS